MDIKVHIMHTGSVWIDRALAFREKSWHPLPYTGWFRPSSNKIQVPVSAYLIEHPKGLVLIDTGWNEEMRSRPNKHLGFLASSMFRGELPEGQAIHEQLGQKGLTDRDLEFVVLTHLHSDHVSGVKHVGGAKNIIVSEPEWAARKSLGYIPSMWEGVPIKPFGLQPIPYGPFKLGLDLCGDGTIYLVYTPGHSKGQLSVMVLLEEGWVLLASDVGYAASSWERGILPGVTTNITHAQQSLRWVKEFPSDNPCLAILANHDPNVHPQVICSVPAK